MRNISFSLTERQFLDGSKDVTRRLGWWFLRVAEHLMGCRKCMGLRKGESIVRLGEIEVVSLRPEPLNAITADEVRREGFPGMTPAEFVEMFVQHMRCKPDETINRIEFRRVTP